MHIKKLVSKIDTNIPDIYYHQSFRRMIEQNMQSLRKSKGVTHITLTDREKEVYKGNFYGILYEHGVPVSLHWLILRLNDLDSTTDYNGQLDKILIPDSEQISRLQDAYLTVHSI